MQASKIVSTPQSRTSVCWINSPNSFSTGYTAQLFNYRKTIKSSRAIQRPRRRASFYIIRKPWHRSVQVQLKLHKEHFISHSEVMLSSCILFFLTKAPLDAHQKILSKFMVSRGCLVLGYCLCGEQQEKESICVSSLPEPSLMQANEHPVDIGTAL